VDIQRLWGTDTASIPIQLSIQKIMKPACPNLERGGRLVGDTASEGMGKCVLAIQGKLERQAEEGVE